MINWDAVRATSWRECSEDKQAEFLIEDQFPWELFERIGVFSEEYSTKVKNVLDGVAHCPVIEIKPGWYY